MMNWLPVDWYFYKVKYDSLLCFHAKLIADGGSTCVLLSYRYNSVAFDVAFDDAPQCNFSVTSNDFNVLSTECSGCADGRCRAGRGRTGFEKFTASPGFSANFRFMMR